MNSSAVTESQRKEIWRIFQQAPKPQLHLHLDGSLGFDFIMEAAERLKARKPEEVIFEPNWSPSNEEDLFLWLSKIMAEDVSIHFKAEEADNWRAFNFCNKFLQRTEDLVSATFQLVCRISKEHNVNYLEVRFAPILHTLEGLKEKEVVLAVAEGFEKGVQHLKSLGKDIHGGIILCALRSFPVSDAIDLVKLIAELKSESVLAFDIAGDEGNYPLRNFKEALLLAKQSNINMTLHAGEWSEKLCDTIIDNIQVAVDAGAARIGHGIALRSLEKDSELLCQLKAKNVGVEVNLTSNCTNPRNVANFAEHPLPKMLENEIKIAGLSTDNWLLAGNADIGRAEPTGEFVRAFVDCGVNAEQLMALTKAGYTSGFRSVDTKFVDDAMDTWMREIIPKLNAWKEKNMS